MVAKVEPPRSYLGLSGLGDPCHRKTWLRFRWAFREAWTAETLKRFEDGHLTEDIWMARLRLVPGLHVWDRDPATGRQWSVTCASGHAKGHLDGKGLGLLQAPKTQHVLEVKASEKGPAKLAKLKDEMGEKQALKAWSPTYYVQAATYMLLSGLDRHYLLCSYPGGRGEPVTVRTDLDKTAAKAFIALAERLAFAAEPPERIGPATLWTCKGCGFYELCHGPALPERNCRTCLSSTPLPEGRWRCERYEVDLTEEQQRVGCETHRLIPALVNGQQVDVRGLDIVYRMPSGEWVDSGQ